MASIASAFAQSLPKPKYTGEDEEAPARAAQRGPRIVAASELDETQVVLKVSLASFSSPLLFSRNKKNKTKTAQTNGCAAENKSATLWTATRMAATGTRRLWRRRRVSRDSLCTVSTRHGPARRQQQLSQDKEQRHCGAGGRRRQSQVRRDCAAGPRRRAGHPHVVQGPDSAAAARRGGRSESGPARPGDGGGDDGADQERAGAAGERRRGGTEAQDAGAPGRAAQGGDVRAVHAGVAVWRQRKEAGPRDEDC